MALTWKNVTLEASPVVVWELRSERFSVTIYRPKDNDPNDTRYTYSFWPMVHDDLHLEARTFEGAKREAINRALVAVAGLSLAMRRELRPLVGPTS